MKFMGIEKLIGNLAMGTQATPRSTDALGTRAPEVNTSLAVATEIFELSCVCAVTDRSYVLQYERTAEGKLRFVKPIKSDAATETFAGSVSRGPSTIPLDAFETRTFPCPWCGVNSIIACAGCDSLVCGGRVHKKVFHCRASCGNSGMTTPIASLKGETEKSGRPAGALREPAGNTLAMRAGSNLARR
jgi:hypothetical protein